MNRSSRLVERVRDGRAEEPPLPGEALACGVDRGACISVDHPPIVVAELLSQPHGALGPLFRQAADGSGVAERLTQSRSIQRPTAALRDGSGILFFDRDGIQLLTLNSERQTQTMVQSAQGVGHGVVSPDSRWLAYVSRDANAPSQVFVSPFANPDRGTNSRVEGWRDATALVSRRPRDLLHRADGMLMSAAGRPGKTLGMGIPRRVRQRPYYNGVGLVERPDTYDVAPDGRFLMLKQASSSEARDLPATVVVVKNWLEELERLVPVAR